MSITPRRKIRIFFLKWHRTLGLAAGLFVLILVGTGIALNHGNSLALDQSPAPRWSLPLYGIDPLLPEKGFRVGDQWLVESEHQLFFGDIPMGRCAPPLAGAVALNQMVLVVCQDVLYLLTGDGALIESSSEIPEPLTSLQENTTETVTINGQFNSYGFDVDEFSWQQLENVPDEKPLLAESVPGPLAQRIADQMVVADITWERFLLDLHSGRLFGEWGVWFVDLVAIILAVLAISGVWLRLSRPGRKH